MRYEIVFAETALEHYHALDASKRATIKAAITNFLHHEPEKTSKSRIKRLRELDQPQYRLRVDDYRVFYDITGTEVLIIAIVPKADAADWPNQFCIPPSP